jgi:DNA polymerase I-like protein with 3'-5' exonuclease and polymerase domains
MLGIPELARRLHVDEREAKRLKAAFLDDAFPEIRDFQQAVIGAFKRRGWVKDILGRVAWLEDKRYAYQGVSRVIQNSGGEHMKTGLIRVNEIEDAYPDEFNTLLSIHDSTIFQTGNEKLAEEARRVLEGVAQEPDFDIIVPIPVDVGKGKNWSEASYG